MHSVRTSIAAAFAIISLGGSITLAQLTDAYTETLSVPVGSIFEIEAVVPADTPVSWALSQGDTFMEASRERIFSTRFSREGTYNLVAQVDTGADRVLRTFTLMVSAQPRTSQVSGNDSAVFDPPVINDRIGISANRQIVTITPVRDDIRIHAIDFDTNVDSSGDGNPQNDEDTTGTLFRSEGNRLHLWFINAKPTTIRLGALFEDNTTQFVTAAVGTTSPATTQQPPTGTAMQDDIMDTQGSVQIMVLKNDNGEVQFSLRRPAEETAPVLLYWEFGDGNSSLLDRPIHTYVENGQHTVQVTVRDLQTGRVLENTSSTVQVNRTIDTPDTQEPDTPDTTDSGMSSSSLLGIVFKLLLSLIGSAIFGGVIFFVINKVKSHGFSLEKTLEKAEQTIVKTPEETVSEAPPPMEISVEEIPEPEPEPVFEPPAPAVTHTEMQPSAEQLQTDTTAAPDWLQAGIQKAEEIGQTPTTPPPSVEPAPEPTTSPSPSPAPDWLQEAEPSPLPTPTPDPSKEDRERERKRRKRQRYRENLKQRKTDESPEEPMDETVNPDEPVAFITAEEILPAEPADIPQSPPQPPTEQPPVDQPPVEPQQ